MPTPIALALLSGGLDSLLAARVVKAQGIDVRGVVFDSGFFSLDLPGRRLNAAGELHPLLQRAEPAMAAADIPVELIDVSEAFFRMLLKPAHGYGSHLNPCIDCKILFLRRARERLAELGGDFLITGEVLGQRPMSQNSQALQIIERQAGVQDILLRPLSAKCLPPTKPEREGVVDRERLCDFSGRTRKPQMDLAARLGITDYSQPAGGCVLTEESFERRFQDWREHAPADRVPTFEQMVRLRLGRHFRLPGGGKIIIGRNARENDCLYQFRGDLPVVKAVEVPGPVALVEENGDPASRPFVLGAVARYADTAPGTVAVEWQAGGQVEIKIVTPLCDEALSAVRI